MKVKVEEEKGNVFSKKEIVTDTNLRKTNSKFYLFFIFFRRYFNKLKLLNLLGFFCLFFFYNVRTYVKNQFPVNQVPSFFFCSFSPLKNNIDSSNIENTLLSFFFRNEHILCITLIFN